MMRSMVRPVPPNQMRLYSDSGTRMAAPDRRSPQRAAAAEHGHEQHDDGDLGREQPLGVQHQHVLAVEGAGDRHHGAGDDEGQHLVAGNGDAEAGGRIRLVAQRLQAEAEAAAAQLPHQEIADAAAARAR